MTDVVYVLGGGSPWNDNELRFSLRSLEAYIGGIRNVYLVGAVPSWITGVIALPYPDRYTCKERNIMEKVAYACGHPDLSDNFLHVHDDHFALAPMNAADIPNWCGGPLDNLARTVEKRNHWRDAVLNTFNALKAEGHTVHNFDLHTPILFNKGQYPETMDLYDWRGQDRGFVVKSLYANTLKVVPTRYHDLKVNNRHTFRDLVGMIKGRPWFSLGNGGLTGSMKQLLHELYPNPSRFEV